MVKSRRDPDYDMGILGAMTHWAGGVRAEISMTTPAQKTGKEVFAWYDIGTGMGSALIQLPGERAMGGTYLYQSPKYLAGQPQARSKWCEMELIPALFKLSRVAGGGVSGRVDGEAQDFADGISGHNFC